MFNLTYNSLSNYWLVKNDAGETLFASDSRNSAQGFIDAMELDASQAYHDWLMQQDAKFLEEV